jgi:hypothetical protein
VEEAPRKAREAASDPAQAEQQEDDRKGSDARRSVRVVGCEPGEGDGGDVFAGGEGDVGDGFGARGDQGSGGGLGGVGDCGDCSSGSRRDELQLRGELVGSLVGEYRGDRNADKGVGGVPEEIEAGNLVGEEFHGKEDGGDGDDPAVGEGVEAGRGVTQWK